MVNLTRLSLRYFSFIFLSFTGILLVQSYDKRYENKDSGLYSPKELKDAGTKYDLDTAFHRYSRTPNHVHRNMQEEFQCVQHQKRSNAEGQPNFLETCPKAKHSEIQNSQRSLVCGTPHLETIRLKIRGPNYELVPSVARVKRCSGHCQHSQLCMPSKKSKILIPVYEIDKTGLEAPTCVDFELEQHDECRCRCDIQRDHCTERQRYNEGRCACICENQGEKRECLELAFTDPEKGQWDETTCSCFCVPQECPRPMVWVPSLCRCASISDEMENALYLEP